MTVSVEILTLGGESVTEAILGEWQKKVGDFVQKGDVLVELETDKISVEVTAPASGVIKEIKSQPEDTIVVGDVIAIIDADASAPAPEAQKGQDAPKADKPAPSPSDDANGDEPALSPAVHRLITENDLNPSKIKATGPNGRLLKEDVLNHLDDQKSAKSQPAAAKAPAPAADTTALEERVKMTPLRKTIARRLVEAQQQTAMLTTFNEVDMSAIMELRKSYQDQFVKKYGIKLGFMSFFVKAVIEGLKEYPSVNAQIDGEEIVYKNFYNIGVAVGGGKGLVVPVLRDADQLSLAGVELGLKALIDKVMANKVTLDDLQGGTFSISNGGIYGSMLSTPILNAPQSGILGMHNIVERPVAINGKVEIRPIMYLALSYDHRIIDGREAVSFLVRVKQCLENPERILLEV